jgi:Mat/Ecp fimbriae periplasmic chaperone
MTVRAAFRRSGYRRRQASLPALTVAVVVLPLWFSPGLGVTPARAGMILDKVIVDFSPNEPSRDDIEITNAGDEILYVSVEPSEIVDPGEAGERRVTDPDPRALGLLVSPNRLALGPGERKILRFSLLDRPVRRDRIYRVAIQPAVGELTATRSALKVLVGYDVLVIARPPDAHPVITASRDNDALLVRNLGNTNALLFDGRQCDEAETDCVELPSMRIYAGNAWRFDLPRDGPVRYLVESSNGTTIETFHGEEP